MKKRITINELASIVPEDINYGILRYGKDFNQKIRYTDISEIKAQFRFCPIAIFDIRTDKDGNRYLWAMVEAH